MRSPGTKVSESADGFRTMQGVDTAAMLIAGVFERGAVDEIGIVSSWAEFETKYGGLLADYLSPLAVYNFFNVYGGKKAYIARVCAHDAYDDFLALAAYAWVDSDELKISAKSPGLWGDKIDVLLTAKSLFTGTCSTKSADNLRLVLNAVAGLKVGSAVTYDSVIYIINRIDSETKTIYLTTTVSGAAGLPITSLEYTFDVYYQGVLVETFQGCSPSPAAPHYVPNVINATSNFLEITGTTHVCNGYTDTSISLTGGDDGLTDMTVADFTKADEGINLFDTIEDTMVTVVAPDLVNPVIYNGAPFDDDDIQSAQGLLIAYVNTRKCGVFILDCPYDCTKGEGVGTATAYLQNFNDERAVSYFPWVKYFNTEKDFEDYAPPSCWIPGVYASVDATRGVHKAPAGVEVKLLNIISLATEIKESDNEVLMDYRINALRLHRGWGYVVWGARTTSSDSRWQYINVIRHITFMEMSLQSQSKWIIFEPNQDDPTWASNRLQTEDFCFREWKKGALVGATSRLAYFVIMDETNNTASDIELGNMNCDIGVSESKPGEFYNIRIKQIRRSS